MLVMELVIQKAVYLDFAAAIERYGKIEVSKEGKKQCCRR
jgi:hypothetical protein